MVVEALNEVPVDIGVLVNIKFIRDNLTIDRHPHIIDSGLRMRFIEIRDEMMEIIANARDPGTPKTCPEDCPYRKVCWGE